MNDFHICVCVCIRACMCCLGFLASVGASVIYISTDYVFDGKNPPYKETDTPNPLNKYGKSKLEGEKVTLAEGKCKFFVLDV